MKPAYATPEWRDGNTGDFKGWMRTGIVRPLAGIQTKDGEYPRGGDPYHDEHGRLASAPMRNGAAEMASPSKRDARLPAKALSYANLRSIIAKNNRSGLPDDLITAIAWRQSVFNPSSVNPVTKAKGLLGVSHWATDDLKRIGQNYDGENLCDPAINVEVGTAYLAIRLRAKHGQLLVALDHYGTGPGTGYGAEMVRAAAAVKANRTDPIGELIKIIGKR